MNGHPDLEAPLLELAAVGFTHEGALTPTLGVEVGGEVGGAEAAGIDLTIEEGEFVVLIGSTGTGKSTLLRTCNALVPRFTGGTLRGRVRVDGRDTATQQPRDLADVVGYVAQDPMSSFVTDTVEDELAYTMESIGLTPDVMRVRVEETLDLLGLERLRRRRLNSLSGGEKQRVAIGSALTAHPRLLIADEPTSALDPQGAEEVLAALVRLVDDLAMTVLLAEHRLERVVQYADRLIELAPGRSGGAIIVADGPPAEVMRTAAVHPPVVELGRRAGWDPLPMSVRDARRRAAPLRRAVNSRNTVGTQNTVETQNVGTRNGTAAGTATARSGTLAEVTELQVRRGSTLALRGVDLRLDAGSITAVMGRNGAGKSTLLAALVGLVAPDRGRVRVGGLRPDLARPAEVVTKVGLVPQDPGDLLYATSVAAECRGADRDFAAPPGTCAGLLTELAPGIDPGRHPRDLSEGQRMCLALAVVLCGRPPLLLLDEPTRGLDYPAKRRLADRLRDFTEGGGSVLLSTHDVELVAALADRVLVLAEGEVVADGPTASVVTGSPMFAPQVAKILAPLPVLTVDDAARQGLLP